MATPSSQPPLAHIKTAARKLPVKRKSPHSSSSAPLPSTPFLPVKLEHSLNPADAAPAPTPAPASTPTPPRPADDFDDDDEEPDPDDVDQDDGDAAGRAGGGSIPFKFQRIWSEPDEIRFLQGLLACSQGMTFPRDLNLYFDRFSETMSQPYSRSQLSEKLRRLRKKFRSHAARVARGLDPSALPPHDRDLFHLSTLLWDPAFAAASPFGASSSRAVPGNKRRRHVPVAGGSGATAGGSGVRARSSAVSCPPRPIHALPPPSPPTHALPSPPTPPPPASCSPPPPPKDAKCDRGLGGCSGSQEEQPPSQKRKPIIGSRNEGLGQLAAKTALDVFDCCLKEVRANLVRRGLLPSDQGVRSGPEGDLSNKWREQRVAELDVLARRLRLALDS